MFLVCIKFNKGGNSLSKHFERTANIRSNLQISLLSRNQTNTKWGRKVFLQLGRICFRILLRQSENFGDFCKVLSQFAFRNMIVPLPKSQTRHPARARAPFPLPHRFFDEKSFYKIFPLLPIVIAKSRLNASGISSRHVVFVRRLGDLVSTRKIANRGRCLQSFVVSKKHVWEMEGRSSARWMTCLGFG